MSPALLHGQNLFFAPWFGLPPSVSLGFGKSLPEPQSSAIVQFDPFFELAEDSFHSGIDKPIVPSPDLIVLAEMEILLPLAKKQIYDRPSGNSRNGDN